MKGRYPPLNALLVFLVASRTQSFTKAAETLFVTRSAVSRQIKTLEDYLGKPLFERHKASLEMTEEGLQYANSLSLIFADLKVATDTISGRRQRGEMKLTLNLSATFSACWLMNRLVRFEDENPDIAVSFITNSVDIVKEPVVFDDGKIDAAFRLGTGQWDNCHFDKVLDNYVQPVCAPKLIGHRACSNIRNLENYTWLHYKHVPNLWDQWLESAGAPGLKSLKKDVIMDNVAVATQAAVDGVGILPVYRSLADQLIDDGKIIPAHDHMMKKNESYYFVCPKNYEKQPAIRVFREWIVEEAERFNAQWHKKVGATAAK